MGKDKIERSFRLKFDNAVGGSLTDLSSDLLPGSTSGAGKALEEIELTGVSTAVRHYLTGFATSTISARFHMNDTASTGSFTILKSMFQLVGTLQLEYGQNGAAPTTGDPRWYGEYVLVGMSAVPDAGRLLIEAMWSPADDTGGQWGTV